jgi:hypothetical protein
MQKEKMRAREGRRSEKDEEERKKDSLRIGKNVKIEEKRGEMQHQRRR